MDSISEHYKSHLNASSNELANKQSTIRLSLLQFCPSGLSFTFQYFSCVQKFEAFILIFCLWSL